MTERLAWVPEHLFNSLPEYSTSLPTGTIVGKQWKRNVHWHEKLGEDEWWLGEYVPYHGPEPDQVGIEWSRIIVVKPHGGPNGRSN